VRKKYDKYEFEIIVSLGVLFLFLISINFISGYSFEKAAHGQAAQFERATEISANFIKNELEKSMPDKGKFNMEMIESLRDLSLLTGIEDISIVDTTGAVIMALEPGAAANADTTYTVRVKRPLRYQGGRLAAFVILKADNITARNYKRLSRWDIVFRIAGVLSAIVIAFFFIRAVLSPYRKIKHEALNYNLDFMDMKSGRGIEYIVDTFKEVIDELEDKKSQLEIMYNNSEKRANSLARYNDYILGSISSGVVICDSNGNVTRFNRSAENILRFFEKDCRGKHYREIFGKDHRLTALLDDALFRGTTHSRKEFEIKRPDNERLWLGCSSSMINDEKGEGMGAVLLMIDLTEIRRLQELSSYSEKMASLGEMSAGLAHEIRNSFAAVLGFAKLLRKKSELTARDSELVNAIITESDSAETLLKRFLSFATPLNYCPENIHPASLIKSLLETLTHPSIEKIKIENRVDNDLPEFLGDPVLLKQALNNLMLNACDALPDGGEILIETKYNVYKFGRPDLTISVSDSGIGIPHENLDKIFDPFYTDKANGTGLGLAVVKKIVVLHQGRIEVKSKPGKGTRFTVYIPIVRETAVEPAELKKPAEILKIS